MLNNWILKTFNLLWNYPLSWMTSWISLLWWYSNYIMFQISMSYFTLYINFTQNNYTIKSYSIWITIFQSYNYFSVASNVYEYCQLYINTLQDRLGLKPLYLENAVLWFNPPDHPASIETRSAGGLSHQCGTPCALSVGVRLLLLPPQVATRGVGSLQRDLRYGRADPPTAV